jgi:radical SAM superfamily enzyme YgiQ (UPF0313 family)
MSKRIILVARDYSIEPVGIHYLAGTIRDAGWECKVVLVRETDFEPLYAITESWKPDLVGFQIWTGYHIPAFVACDRVRELGAHVIIGGPHATYFNHECQNHADWTIVASGFAGLRQILDGTLAPGVYFEPTDREVPFPLPDRQVIYNDYPKLAMSPIKSMFCSVGCPYTCTYCYAPTFNMMHGGFSLTTRSVDDLIEEALEIQERWPAKMVYFQDDIFGFQIKWLEEFAHKWKEQVGLPFHCQIRLELTQHASGERRLNLFRDAGCTGITLAIESGNAFLRDHVLHRHMDHELIVAGCRKILDRGMTLRTEQILAVPFSNTETDLATLALNNEIRPTMTWTSILAPFAGTNMGSIANQFGFYRGNNDDLAESFFERSVLRHVEDGPEGIDRIVRKIGAGPKDHVLLQLRTSDNNDGTADVLNPSGESLGTITYLSPEENEQYCQDTVRLQRLFMSLAKMPQAQELGRRIVDIPKNLWTWKTIGTTIESHLRETYEGDIEALTLGLAHEMGLTTVSELPRPIAENPWVFCVFPAGGVLAKLVMSKRVFAPFKSLDASLDEFGTLSRRHLFDYGLYKIEQGSESLLCI